MITAFIVCTYVDYLYLQSFAGLFYTTNILQKACPRYKKMILPRFIRKSRPLKALMTIIMVVFTVNFYVKLNEKTYNLHRGKWRNLEEEKIQNLSNLGRILFLEENRLPIETRSVPYKILIWKYGPSLVKRHIRNQSNPFQYCSAQNCELTYNNSEIEMADLVVFHLHRTESVRELPNRTSVTQIWAFLTDESPYYTFSYRQENGVKPYNGLFNWSMSYRMVSDIPVPYGRTVLLETKRDKIDIVEWNRSKRQDVLVAIMISNCSKKRLMYVKELSQHIKVDVYGRCGNLTCPGHFHSDCEEISKYKFYLSFENSNCDEYITEKVWWNGYHKNAIPIVMGGSKLSLQQSLPPNSYIDVNDFLSPGHLAKHLVDLNSSLSALEKLFEWKRDFKILNEHGYFKSLSVHYCRICEALNYNSKKTKIYNNLEEVFNLNVCR